MSLYHRLKRRLGYDTTIEKEFRKARYEYKVKHLNGNVSQPKGHYHERDEGFLLVYSYTNGGWNKATACLLSHIGKAIGSGKEKVAELEGIESVHREERGEDVWTVTVDWADHSLVDVEHHFEEA